MAESQKPDEQLIRAVQAGSHESFKILYERYSKRIYNYIYYFLGNAADAEDCTHEVFITLFRRAKLFKFKSKFSTWLYSIAKNTSLNYLKKRKRRRTDSLDEEIPNTEGGLAQVDLIETPGETPSESAIAHELEQALVEGLGQLVESDRQVILLCAFEQLPHKEVADIMGWPVINVRVQLHRARTRLDKILSRKGLKEKHKH